MKRTALALTLVLALLLSALAGQSDSVARANPYYITEVPPPEGTEPPTISVTSPLNNSAFASNNLSIAFKVSISKGTSSIEDVYYEVDWKEGNISVYTYGTSGHSTNISEFPYNETLVGVPEGNHSLHITATAFGSHVVVVDMTNYIYFISCSSSIYFTVDTTSPSVSVLSLENKSYTTSDLPLNFTVNEHVSQISYVLDGLDNVTINGNTTLNQLAYGDHNLTVYATDEAGNVGASETIYFTVTEPFPTTLVIATSGTFAAVAGTGLLWYLRKRRIKSGDKHE